MKKLLCLGLLLSLSILIVGCGYGDWVQYSSEGQTNKYIEDQEKRHYELQGYMEKTKDQIREIFGKPHGKWEDIPVLLTPGCKKSDCKYATAEEVWIYKYSKGFIPFFSNYVYSYFFYFIDGKVKYIKP
ncbi:MAG: hypothetical protein P9M07_02800 [Candidatus Aceula meridiana]|nr:hypothetical protein [Candidatus Aceula meridiana]